MTELFDRAHFQTMTAGDVALQSEIIALFQEQAARWAAVLTAETPAPQCSDAAHTLKGSARGMGLWRLAEACADVERALIVGDGASALAKLHEELRDALAALGASANAA